LVGEYAPRCVLILVGDKVQLRKWSVDMKKIYLGIPLLFVALAVACAQQSGGDRQAGSRGYTPWAGAQTSSSGAVG